VDAKVQDLKERRPAFQQLKVLAKLLQNQLGRSQQLRKLRGLAKKRQKGMRIPEPVDKSGKLC
jgi:hypothetical protein